MNLAQAIQSTMLKDAKVVAAARCLDHDIRWVHMVDHPEIARWVKPGQLLLSTGYNWPRVDADADALVRELHRSGLAGVVLAVPHFLECFSPAAIAAAEEVGLPLLELPWEIQFSAITEEIHSRIIRCQTQVIERAEAIHVAMTQAAMHARDLSDLACALADLLERSVTFVDPEGVLLGGCEVSDTRRRDERLLLQAAKAGADFERVLGSAAPGVVALDDPREPGTTLRRLGCPIKIGGDVAAVLWVDEAGKALGELDVRASEHAAVIAALHISHARALTAQEERLGYAFVSSLLEGRFDDTPSMRDRIALNGWDPAGEYRVCLVLVAEPLPLTREGLLRVEEIALRLRRHLARLGEPGLIAVSLNQVRVLLSARQSPEALWNEISSRQAAMGVSRVHAGAEGMAQGGADVAWLMDRLKPGRLHWFDELIFPRALLGDANARSMLIDKTLGRLLDDRSDATLETVEALCAEGFQLAATARRLSIHISTLRYRLERIERATGLSLDMPAHRFELQVAMSLRQASESYL